MPSLKGDEGLERDAVALHRVLTDLIRVYQFRDRDAVCCYDISTGQSHGLERLANHSPMTLTAFAASLFLEKSSASRLADQRVLQQPQPEAVKQGPNVFGRFPT